MCSHTVMQQRKKNTNAVPRSCNYRSVTGCQSLSFCRREQWSKHWHHTCTIRGRTGGFMFQYQLRMPASMSLNDLIREIALNSWNVFHSYSESKTVDGGYLQFRKEIFNSFSPYLKAFALCGSSGICEDEMRPVGATVDDLDTKIYQLQLPLQMDLFVEHLASLVIRKFRPGLIDPERGKARAELKTALQAALEPYLFINPWCGKAQLCRFSTPIDPWRNSGVSDRDKD